MKSDNAPDALCHSWRQRSQQSAQLTDCYLTTVRNGRKLMADSRVVLCGLARNVAEILPQTRARLERTGAMFGDYRIFLYENDSNDGTSQLLADWQAANSRMTFRSEALGRQQHPSIRCCNRAADMADYRNRCQQEVAERWSDFDFVCVVDTDLVGGWCHDGLAHSFGSQPWDFVGAYGTIQRRRHLKLKALHYDVWAYREFGDYAPIDGRRGNAMSWNSGDPLVPVYSCFGGLGVYRLPAWLSARYTGEDCEHVTLHRGMRAAGYERQFLNPSQRTCYGSKPRRFDSMLLPLGRALHSTAALFAF
jgi:hypothetical protein